MSPSTILCAVDGAPACLHATRQAIRTFKDDAEFLAVAVAPDRFGRFISGHTAPGGGPGALELMMQTYQHGLDLSSDIAREEGAAFRQMLVSGEPHEQLVQAAKDVHASMIVLGVQRLGRLERRLLGGVAEKVIGYSECDVLLVPEHASLDLSTIILAVDDSDYSRRAESRAAQLALDHHGRVYALSSADFPVYAHSHDWEVMVAQQMQKQARAIAQDFAGRLVERGINSEPLAPKGPAYEAVAAAAAEYKAGLVVMGSHGRTGLRRLLMGSVASRILETSPCAVLVAR